MNHFIFLLITLMGVQTWAASKKEFIPLTLKYFIYSTNFPGMKDMNGDDLTDDLKATSTALNISIPF